MITISDNNIELPQGLSILVAEDNPINQKVAVLTLRHLGLKCDVAKNGLEAFEMYKENRYEVILMDMQMPILDGLTASEKIRSYEVNENLNTSTYIIALTANASSEDKQKCLDSGMNDFICKPFRKDGLRTALSRAIKTVHQNDK